MAKPNVAISIKLSVKNLEGPGMRSESWDIGKTAPRSMAQLLASATQTIVGSHYFLTHDELVHEFELFKSYINATHIREETHEPEPAQEADNRLPGL